ncbi:hypothetical protein [Aequorivita sp. Q41]|uniref:hypothetical protein n=1 Tax=Aequorivita sp. Q41 TaxID=3153300 RepID=UPI0032421492
MKKTFGILIIICFSILSCSKSTSISAEKNDISKYGLKGKVKSIETNLYNFEIKNDSTIIGQGINNFDFDSYSLKEFNSIGFLTYEKTYESELNYFYDSSKKLTKLTEKYNNEDSPSVIYEYDYNQKDSLTKVIYKNDDLERKMIFKRDEKNRRVKRTDYVSDTIQMTYKVDYDKSGNIINENTYIQKSKPSKLISRSYSEQNLLLTEKITEFRSYDTLNYKNIYLYDNDSKVIEIKNNFFDETDYTQVLKKYDSDGCLIEEQWIPKGSNSFVVITQKFDKYGNTIEFSRSPNNDTESDVWISKYKFDKKENWIEKQKFKNDKPVVLVKRKIEYY